MMYETVLFAGALREALDTIFSSVRDDRTRLDHVAKTLSYNAVRDSDLKRHPTLNSTDYQMKLSETIRLSLEKEINEVAAQHAKERLQTLVEDALSLIPWQLAVGPEGCVVMKVSEEDAEIVYDLVEAAPEGKYGKDLWAWRVMPHDDLRIFNIDYVIGDIILIKWSLKHNGKSED